MKIQKKKNFLGGGRGGAWVGGSVGGVGLGRCQGGCERN